MAERRSGEALDAGEVVEEERDGEPRPASSEPA